MASFLIVDPDRNFREALAIALRLDGHSVAAAGTAEDALTAVESCGCCVVDAHSDGADDVLRAAQHAGVRVVVTGPYPELLAHAVARYPRALPLAKPFYPSELAEKAA